MIHRQEKIHGFTSSEKEGKGSLTNYIFLNINNLNYFTLQQILTPIIYKIEQFVHEEQVFWGTIILLVFIAVSIPSVTELGKAINHTYFSQGWWGKNERYFTHNSRDKQEFMLEAKDFLVLKENQELLCLKYYYHASKRNSCPKSRGLEGLRRGECSEYGKRWHFKSVEHMHFSINEETG